MVENNKGNPTRIHSLKFEEPNARFGFSLQIKSDEGEVFDKKQIALAIRNSTFDDELRCSLLDDGILNKCGGCSLRTFKKITSPSAKPISHQWKLDSHTLTEYSQSKRPSSNRRFEMPA